MTLVQRSLQLLIVLVLASTFVTAQEAKNFSKNGLSFDYPSAWTLQESTNDDAQELKLMPANGEVQFTVFAHKGRITPEKMGDAKKAFIDPYVANALKQFESMGLKPKQITDSSEIGGAKADGSRITAVLDGDPGSANIYWALVGNRVVMLTQFGSDKDIKRHAVAWDLIRNSIKIIDPKAVPAASPNP